MYKDKFEMTYVGPSQVCVRLEVTVHTLTCVLSTGDSEECEHRHKSCPQVSLWL